MREQGGRDKRAALALAVVLGVGALLRLLMMFAWRPALMGWPDAASYIVVAHGSLFGNGLRPAGFPLFLRLLHGVAPSLTLVVAVQHLVGLASAVVLYLAVARTGVPRLLGLVPAAIVALGGDGIFLEQSPISETLFIFCVALTLYAGVRALEGERLLWPAAFGLALAGAAAVRVVALPLIPLALLWLLASGPRPLRRRLAVAAVAAAGTLALLGGYYAAEQRAVGHTGLSRNGIWNLYGRVAPFADCSKFDPPPGTAELCETTPRADRPLTNQYTFNWFYSPAIRAFADPHTATPAQTAAVASFTRAVILHQPLDYANEVGASLLRYVVPDALSGYGGGPSYHDLVGREILFNPLYQTLGRRAAREYYTDVGRRYRSSRPLLSVMRGWESLTRIQGPLFVMLALLSLAGPLLASGRARAAAALFALAAWTLLVVPVATVEFSARTAVPGFGPLGAAAALGGWGVLLRWGPALSRMALRRPGFPSLR